MKFTVKIFLLLLVVSSISCGGGINIFSLEDDKALGLQVSEEINSDPVNYPLLSESTYTEAYDHIERITNNVLNSGNVVHKDDFNWTVKIIHDDEVLNAFCTPGGYIYVYTGLIKYLDSEDQLAGVMGHEIAHADLRHTTNQLTKTYGITFLLDIVLGSNQSAITDIAASLLVLKFSRNDETASDESSVNYLCNTEYDARGAARFFEKLSEAGTATPPQFLSTHPDPDNRVENIHQHWMDQACGEGGTFDERYEDFKNSLP